MSRQFTGDTLVVGDDGVGHRNAELGLSTRAIHHGYDPAEEHGALTPPIFMTST